MTDSDRSMNEVPALIQERRRYEAWLAALDARRESTPAHVFERVQGDYRARLQRVAEQLASYRQTIEEERTSVQSRLSLLEAEERLRMDERAELDLRAHVGELIGDEAGKAFRTVDDAINQLDKEKEGLRGRIAELESLLEEGPPTPSQPSPPPEPATTAAAPRIEQRPAEKPASPEQPAAPPKPVVSEKPSAPERPAASEKPAAPEKPASADKPVDSSFDELAFLSSVVGPEDGEPMIETREPPPMTVPSGIIREEANSDSLLAGLDKRMAGDHPLAANVPANTPIVLRPPAGTIEQSKTLKCNECGAMNYPTEWYCERCGAELAAL